MPTPMENDPSLARFRRGSGSRVGPPGPPPVIREYSRGLDPTEAGPITVESVPEQPTVAPRPLFGDLLDGKRTPDGEGLPEDQRAPDGEQQGANPDPRASLFHGPEFDWQSDDIDPGRTSGVVSIIIGLFVGIVGIFVAIFSVRSSRRAGLPGAYGLAGIGVSILSIVVASAIGLSWLRYEISLAQQCSLVGPGVYLTQSGDQVSCR